MCLILINFLFYFLDLDEIKYEVCIVTSEVYYSRKPANVYVTLAGTEGATKRVKVATYEEGVFDANEHNLYEIDHEDLGTNISSSFFHYVNYSK